MIIFQSIVLNIKIVQTWYKQQVGELGVPQIFEKAQSVTKNFNMYVYPFLAVKSVSNFEKNRFYFSKSEIRVASRLPLSQAP